MPEENTNLAKYLSSFHEQLIRQGWRIDRLVGELEKKIMFNDKGKFILYCGLLNISKPEAKVIWSNQLNFSSTDFGPTMTDNLNQPLKLLLNFQGRMYYSKLREYCSQYLSAIKIESNIAQEREHNKCCELIQNEYRNATQYQVKNESSIITFFCNI